MAKKINKDISVLFLILLFLPSIIKLEHKHEKFTDDYSKVLNAFSENCSICNFEFSSFVNTSERTNVSPERFFDYFAITITEVYNSNFLTSTLSLRAPPNVC
jgi:hypothetical protein